MHNEPTCPAKRKRGRPTGFATEMARMTGKSKRTVNRNAYRGARIAKDVLDDLRGTRWDKGVTLDELARLTHDEQRATIRLLLEGKRRNMQTALNTVLHRTEDEMVERWARKMLRAHAKTPYTWQLRLRELIVEYTEPDCPAFENGGGI